MLFTWTVRIQKGSTITLFLCYLLLNRARNLFHRSSFFKPRASTQKFRSSDNSFTMNSLFDVFDSLKIWKLTFLKTSNEIARFLSSTQMGQSSFSFHLSTQFARSFSLRKALYTSSLDTALKYSYYYTFPSQLGVSLFLHLVLYTTYDHSFLASNFHVSYLDFPIRLLLFSYKLKPSPILLLMLLPRSTVTSCFKMLFSNVCLEPDCRSAVPRTHSSQLCGS